MGPQGVPCPLGVPENPADLNPASCFRMGSVCLSLKKLPSLKLTYPLKIDPWKRRFLLETIIFRGYGYVSFRECSSLM